MDATGRLEIVWGSADYPLEAVEGWKDIRGRMTQIQEEKLKEWEVLGHMPGHRWLGTPRASESHIHCWQSGWCAGDATLCVRLHVEEYEWLKFEFHGYLKQISFYGQEACSKRTRRRVGVEKAHPILKTFTWSIFVCIWVSRVKFSSSFQMLLLCDFEGVSGVC